MSLRRSAVLLLASLAACTPPTAQESYRYPGCDDAGTYACPRSLVFTCALNSIEQRYRACTTAADCVLVSPKNCFGHWVCRPAAVNDAGLADFLAEAETEIARYCETPGCAGGPACLEIPSRAGCLNGRCVALREDGGL
jgi:hypothetical protein